MREKQTDRQTDRQRETEIVGSVYGVGIIETKINKRRSGTHN